MAACARAKQTAHLTLDATTVSIICCARGLAGAVWCGCVNPPPNAHFYDAADPALGFSDFSKRTFRQHQQLVVPYKSLNLYLYAAGRELLESELENTLRELEYAEKARNAEDAIVKDVKAELSKAPLNPIGAIMRALARHQPDAAPKHATAASGSIASIFTNDDLNDTELYGDAMMAELRRMGAAVNAAKDVSEAAVDALLDHVGLGEGGITEWLRGRREGEPWEDRAFTMTRFKRLLNSCREDLATGASGVSLYPMRYTHVGTLEVLLTAFREAVRCSVSDGADTYPAEWARWLCVLIAKKNRDPRLFKNLRDIWLLEHGQKLMEGLVKLEFDDAAHVAVPPSQFGFMRRRGAPQPTTVLHVQAEQAHTIAGAQRRAPVYRAYVDYRTLFESIAHKVQMRVEERTGVALSASKAVFAIQHAAHGHYDTQYGVNEPGFPRANGNVQGSHTGPVKSNLVLSVVQRAIELELVVDGSLFVGPDGHEVNLPTLFFADDSAGMSDSLKGVQMYLDAIFATAVALELEPNVPTPNGRTWVKVPHGRALKGGRFVEYPALLQALRGGMRVFDPAKWAETGASERLEADTRVRDPETGDIYTVVTEVTDKTAWQGLADARLA